MKTSSIALAALLLPLCPAAAQDSGDIRVRLGLGAQIRPEFVGAEENKWGPLWDVAIQRGSDPFDFEAPDDSFDIKLLSGDKFSVGPVANLQSGRKDSEIGAPVGDVSTTFELGAFAQYDMSDSVRLRGEMRRGIGGHDGFVSSLGGDYIWRDDDHYVFSIGPRLLLSDARYQRAWFGIDGQTALVSGLPEYRPGGGIHAVAVASGMTYQLNRRWGLFGFARYERLVGNAAKSPLVQQLGSKDQPSAGIGLTYTFSFRR